MRLDQIFKTEFLVESLTSGNKKDVLGELIDVMIKNGLKINSDKEMFLH